MYVWKAIDAAALDARPFAVRAGQHREQRVVAIGEGTGELRLFAAHHVGHATLIA